MKEARPDRPQILFASPREPATSDCACADDSFGLLIADPAATAESDCACEDASLDLPPLIGFVADFTAFSDRQMAMAETDCACAGFKDTVTSRPPDGYHALLQQAGGLHMTSISGAHTAVLHSLQPGPLVVLNSTARRVLERFERPASLVDVAAQFPGCNATETLHAGHQLAALGILEPVVGLPYRLRHERSTLTAWLHVTNACNLRCTYCYVHKTDEAMSETTGLAAIDAVIRSATQHGFRAIKLKYAGGEATLNFRLIQLLHGYAQDQAVAHRLALHEVVLSNGVGLSHDMLDFICDADMRLMISLDGMGADHNTQRVFSNGHGSSRQVAHSVDRAITHGVKPHLSITVTKHNAGGVASAVAFALERKLPFNLNFYRDHDYGVSHAELAAEDTALINGVKAAFQIIEEQLPRQSLVAGLVDRASFAGLHHRPCGAGHSYLVVDHNGRVASCQMEIERSVTDVMAHDPLEIIRLQPVGFQNISVDDKEGCRDCQWRYWCAGGCPLLTYRVTGRSDIQSPYCSVYKALFPELIRLEGLRLLKWAQLAAQ